MLARRRDLYYTGFKTYSQEHVLREETNLLKDVQQYFPIDAFRPGQEQILEAILSGRDVMAVMPTGGGKSLCYQYPAVKFPGLTLVISPLVSLMRDQVENLERRRISAAYINSSVRKKERHKILQNADAGEYRLLYISPERLVSPAFIRFARRVKISMLVVDEAHCISLWGYDFRPDYMKIPQFLELTGKRPVIAAFTATASRHVKEDIWDILGLETPFDIDLGCRRPNLSLSVKHCGTSRKKYRELYKDISRHDGESGIIYCATVENVDSVCLKLLRRGCQAVRYYADLEAEEKKENFRSFLSGKSTIMVATNAFGMGIDKKDIRYVIHFNISKDLESYFQEIGRAGRDNGPAECILYYTPEDAGIFYGFLEDQKNAQGSAPGVTAFLYRLGVKRLRAMLDYAKNEQNLSGEELQDKILAYFSHTQYDADTEAEGARVRHAVLEQQKRIAELYTNETKAAQIIRKGCYAAGEKQRIKIGENRNGPLYVTFCLSGKLSYFDLMVADAVYTLYFYRREKIFVQNILELLSGDPAATMKPEKAAKKKPDKRSAIFESLERLADTTIRIDRSHGMIGFAFPDEKNEAILEGPFLPIIKEGKNGFRVMRTPPLYRYAELTNGQFFRIPTQYLLAADRTGRKLPHSIENMKLCHFLARRIRLMQASRNRGKPVTRRIRLMGGDGKSPSMLDILDLDMPDNPYERKRKEQAILRKTQVILEDFCKKHVWDLQSFEFLQEEDSDSVELHFLTIL